MALGSVKRSAKLKDVPQRSQAALIQAVNAAAPELLEAVLSETPVGRTGALKDAISLGPVTPFGASRVQVAVEVDLQKAPYYYAVIRGVEGGKLVGKVGKFYSDHASGDGSVAFTGQWRTKERLANNFPRRAARKALRTITGLTKKHFIIRVAQ